MLHVFYSSHRHDDNRRIIRIIKERAVEMVGCYKYLCTLIDDRLQFDLNTASVSERPTTAVCTQDITADLVDRAFIESVLTFSIIRWYGNLTIRGEKHF